MKSGLSNFSQNTLMDTGLIGQDESHRILEETLKDPPHLFLTGGYGCGKTTLMKAFLKSYYAQFNIINPGPEWVLNLSSDQDRGIHCVRQSVAEFVRHAPEKEGIYRWILCDDSDSLPMISQQALRRPMETHNHITRFIFCSRYLSDLIPPLRSRCLHLELETISPFHMFAHFSKQYNYNINLAPQANALFLSLSQTPTEMKRMILILGTKYPESTVITPEQLLELFGSPSFSLCVSLLRYYLKGQHQECVDTFFKIWKTGISYEDFLNEMNITLRQIGHLSPQKSQRLHELILKGWIYFAQGKTHSLDMLRLLFISRTFDT
jgi:GTPase SAR1 family protein